MKNNFLQEVLVSLTLIVLLALLLNPFNFWMPANALMAMLVGLMVVFAVFTSFVWREKSRDEREGLHKMMAGKIAFLVGAATLVIGIVIQSFNHKLDLWLVLTLGLMILAKVTGIIYSRARN